MNFTEEEQTLCSPLLETPVSSPNPKKMCANVSAENGNDEVSNSDILHAIHELANRFSCLEKKITKNSADIKDIKEHIEGLDFQTKTTEDKVKTVDIRLSEQRTKIEEAERYSRRWNLRLLNLVEKSNETTEDLRQQVYHLFSSLIPADETKMEFLVDTIHRVGIQRKDGSPRPVLIQFGLRTYRQKIWKASLKAKVLIDKGLRVTEDLTFWERQCRNKLWPLVDRARKEGKKTSWRGPDVIIEGKKITADSVK